MGISCLKKYQFNALVCIFLVSIFFPKQLQDLSSPRFIGSDIVTKKLNFDIQSVMYAFVFNDCCIPDESFNY